MLGFKALTKMFSGIGMLFFFTVLGNDGQFGTWRADTALPGMQIFCFTIKYLLRGDIHCLGV